MSEASAKSPISGASNFGAPAAEVEVFFAPLAERLAQYIDPEGIQHIKDAFVFGANAHVGQARKSGEPYISHPVAVAEILAGLHMDEATLVAAILHDVIEDTAVAREEIVQHFGEEVARLVDGVSKLTQIRFKSKAEAQAANFRKMMMAMVEDVRVILIKLADRLHNMRTLGVMRPDKRRRIARETLDIYTPIASRLGLNALRHELEDMGFAALYPARYRVLTEAVRKARGNRKEVVAGIEERFIQRFADERLRASIDAREKRPYSIYRKMAQKHLSFKDVFDVFAVRIVVGSVDECYRALGIVHNLYKPLPGRFKDYIAIPKANGYQSLHTILFGPHGIPLEVQIRTAEMHQFAESGIAAHWLYKANHDQGTVTQARAREWLRDLLEIQQKAGNPQEFLESVKVDLFPDEVYVFTPMGEIIELPRRATAVDFAYAIHTDVGNTCVSCKIDRRFAPLSTPVENGQTVEIITASGAEPNPNWLSFVVTAKARANIRSYLKNLQDAEAIKLGHRLLTKALSVESVEFEDVQTDRLNQLLAEYHYEGLSDLLRDIGLGNRMAPLVARLLLLDGTTEPVDTEGPARAATINAANSPIIISGTEGLVVDFAKCCHPIPGDGVVGFLSTGRGIVVHRRDCSNAADVGAHPERWLAVNWASEPTGEYQAQIVIHAKNVRGGLARIAASVAETGADIDDVRFDDRDVNLTIITVTLRVSNRVHLARVMRRVKQVTDVVKVVRP
ncbi:bifunctional GTP diphosphokinase/guanosine-3',5'-bis(diphosphate) 3'-diphosphatase [Halothiobacillus diazotrophicus]|uniref:guanosine-3',5'-bis(diphosphate) 3'-diphosphatase n=1 Tax=Halothiobacillus diazotrophicus TaxID=1860122 RepID=A0A191ZI64_9GAMM|nr:bifunctional (p)ppGpp synthetase/guanosine-3',5'-bis(diphosphate) 3'-pyrophosphohydrolase [Halothiobacillus diazotrophicus]ANJ67538.1 bifunctional GTP diphosphokinase/guanosine-3',5'-bis(diphosphate) 3'-diphosphatase [Halothiobacillus diazotrophicus]